MTEQTISTDIFAAYKERLAKYAQGADDAASGLRRVFIYLKTVDPRLGAIEVEYDGCGDSGQVETVHYAAIKPEDQQALAEAFDTLEDQPLPDDVAGGRQHTPGHFVPGKGWVTTGQTVNFSAAQLIDELAWDLAYGRHPGFEINEGGYGTVRITEDTNDAGEPIIRVSLSHSERIIETNDYDYEF